MKATQINELYQAAFTGLPIVGHRRHFVMAVLDCFSRYLLALRVSPTGTVADLTEGLKQALEEARLVSELPNDRAITLVIDTGLDSRALSDCEADLPFHLVIPEDRTFRSVGLVRRFLWALKDEEIAMNLYRDAGEADRSMTLFRHTYNFKRPHQALGYKVPAALFCKNFMGSAGR